MLFYLCLALWMTGSLEVVPGPAASPPAGMWDPPPVGFVWHYPYVKHEDDLIARSGATALICRGGFPSLQKEGAPDFWSVDAQIEFARRYGLKLVMLHETGPVHAPGWLQQKVKQAGESLHAAGGQDDATPSFSSPVFAQAHGKLVRDLAARVRQQDRDGVVIAAQPGAEWWYLTDARSSPLDAAAFRRWLARKYGRIEALNRVWGAHYRAFAGVDLPALSLDSNVEQTTDLAGLVPTLTHNQDVSWSLHGEGWIPVEAGRAYTFRAWVRTRGATGQGASLSIAWWGGKDRVGHDEYSARVRGTAGWRRVELTVTVPPGADRAWPLLKLRGPGEAWFDGVEFAPKGETGNMLPPPSTAGPKGWNPDNWTQSAGVEHRRTKGEGREGGDALALRVPLPRSGYRFRNLGAAAYDANRFAAEYMADYIQGFCRRIKQADPTRPTAGYLTFAFSNMLEWDYIQQTAMSLGVALPRMRDLDILGMQICSADGDPLRVTGCLDIARKYGKPMWAVDLLDFTSGVAVGPDVMRRVTQAAIQHGATGLFYYCWHGTPDYDFYPGLKLEDLRAMQSEAVESIRAVQGMKRIAPVALVQPYLPTVYTDPGGRRNDFRDFGGLYKALQDLRLGCDIWTVEELEQPGADLSRYAAVVLPDCAFLSDRAAQTLQRYARRGRLVRSGRWALYDEYGAARRAVPPLRAVRLGEKFGAAYLGRMLRTTHAGNTPPLFIETGDPAARDRVRARLLPVFARALKPVTDREEASLAAGRAGLRLALFKGAGRRAVFLVNEAAAPAQGVRVRMAAVSTGERFRALADGAYLPVTASAARAGWREVRLPAFRYSCILLGDARLERKRLVGEAFNYVLGTQTFGPTYRFSGEDALRETAKAIQSMRSNVLKFTMAPTYADSYPGLKRSPDIRSLADLAAKEPAYRAVLDMPFAYYLIWAYPFQGASWFDGVTPKESRAEYREVYDLARYLLQRYDGSGKTFYLGHWEGDWHLHPGYDPAKDPTPEALQGMRDWLNVRQKAIEDAKRDTPHRGVQVWQYTEVNLVQKAMKGGKTLTNDVLPHTRVDYVSYSSYDSLNGEGAALRERMKQALDYIQSKLPPKPGVPGKRVFIGEYGFPSESVGAERQAVLSREVARAAVEWGCPFALYWEMYNNEVKDGKARGFWMIDDRGERQPVYHLHARYYDAARRYVADFRRRQGRLPSADEFRREALRLLEDEPSAGAR